MREYIHVDDAAKASIDAINSEFRNRVCSSDWARADKDDMLKMLAEILGLSLDKVEFVEEHMLDTT